MLRTIDGLMRQKKNSMTRIFLLSIFNICMLTASGQLVKLFHEKEEQGYTIYANNDEFCPVSVSIDLDVTNLIFSGGQKNVWPFNGK